MNVSGASFVLIFGIVFGRLPAAIFRIWDHSRVHVGSFCTFVLLMLRNSTNATLSNEMLGFGRRGPTLSYRFCKLRDFLCVAMNITFVNHV